MPRRKVLNAQEKSELLELPNEREILVDYYTLSAEECGWIRQVNGDVNRLGFAVQLALMKYPGVVLRSDWQPSEGLVKLVAEQAGVPATLFEQYPTREQTLFDHRVRLQSLLKLRPYHDRSDRQAALVGIQDLALRTDRGAVIVRALIEDFRKWHILLPSVAQLDLLAAEAITRGEQALDEILTSTLNSEQEAALRNLLTKKRHGKYELTWLTESVEVPTVANILGHIERLLYLRSFRIPDSLRERVHEERLQRIAEITSESHLPNLRQLKPRNQHAILVAVLLEFEAKIIDELLMLNGKMVGAMHNNAKVKHEEKKEADEAAMLEGALLAANLQRILNKGRKDQTLPYDEIAKVITWDNYQRLADDIRARTKDHSLGSLPFVSHSYSRIHRYAGALLKNLDFRAAPPVRSVLDAIEAVKKLHSGKTGIPELPTEFVPAKWKPLVMQDDGVHHKYYELCAMTRLNECLRSGDISVKRSHRFKDFEDYLIPKSKYESIKAAGCLPVAIEVDCEKYLRSRIAAITTEVKRVEALAKAGLLEGVTATDSRIKIARLEANTPIEATALSDALYDLLPPIKITDMVQEVDSWFHISRCFLDRRSGQEPKDRSVLYAALLAKGINLGCEKMAQACPDEKITRARLELVDQFCLRPEGFTSAMGMLLNEQKQIPISSYWGDATTSSSDGQRFRTTRHAYDGGTYRGKYGSEPGRSVLTTTCDLWTPVYSTVIAGPDEEAAYTLDGLLYSDPSVVLQEHYTDTAGFSDHLFALTHLYGYRYAVRVRKFSEFTLHLPEGFTGVDALKPMVSRDALDLDAVSANWDDILRAATSIKHGTVRASALMKKLASYPRQNRLAHALREFGRIERTLFMLQWISDPEFRRRVHRGLNKGEAVHALVKTVSSIGRAGELRDRTLQQQIRRANGFNLLVSIISVWNTVYLDRALNHLTRAGVPVNRQLLTHMAPLGHDHINLTGDYIWGSPDDSLINGFRPLRAVT